MNNIFRKIFFGIIFLLTPFFVFANTLTQGEVNNQISQGNILSDSFSSLNNCNLTKDKYNNEFSSYKRSDCFGYEGGFYYFICQGGTSCNLNLTSSTTSTNTQNSVTQVNIPNQAKLDVAMNKIRSMEKEFTPEKYIQFLEAFEAELKKLGNKYSGNTTIQQMIGYLGVETQKIKSSIQIDNKQNSQIDDFFCDLLKNCDTNTNTNSTTNTTTNTNTNSTGCNWKECLGDGYYVADVKALSPYNTCKTSQGGYNVDKCILYVDGVYIAPVSTEKKMKKSNNNDNSSLPMEYCKNLNIGGLSNWSLPIVSEFRDNNSELRNFATSRRNYTIGYNWTSEYFGVHKGSHGWMAYELYNGNNANYSYLDELNTLCVKGKKASTTTNTNTNSTTNTNTNTTPTYGKCSFSGTKKYSFEDNGACQVADFECVNGNIVWVRPFVGPFPTPKENAKIYEGTNSCPNTNSNTTQTVGKCTGTHPSGAGVIIRPFDDGFKPHSAMGIDEPWTYSTSGRSCSWGCEDAYNVNASKTACVKRGAGDGITIEVFDVDTKKPISGVKISVSTALSIAYDNTLGILTTGSNGKTPEGFYKKLNVNGEMQYLTVEKEGYEIYSAVGCDADRLYCRNVSIEKSQVKLYMIKKGVLPTNLKSSGGNTLNNLSSSACKEKDFYWVIDGVDKKNPPKGCARKYGSTGTCVSLSDFREYLPSEWASNTRIITTGKANQWPTGAYELFLAYGDKIIQAGGTMYLKSCQ